MIDADEVLREADWLIACSRVIGVGGDAMPRPISADLRAKIVGSYRKHLDTYADIAKRFHVGEATVSRLLRKNRETGDLSPKAAGGRRRASLTESAVAYLLSLIRDEPNWTTSELADEVSETHGVKVSRHAVGRALRTAGITFKRGSSESRHFARAA